MNVNILKPRIQKLSLHNVDFRKIIYDEKPRMGSFLFTNAIVKLSQEYPYNVDIILP